MPWEYCLRDVKGRPTSYARLPSGHLCRAQWCRSAGGSQCRRSMEKPELAKITNASRCKDNRSRTKNIHRAAAHVAADRKQTKRGRLSERRPAFQASPVCQSAWQTRLLLIPASARHRPLQYPGRRPGWQAGRHGRLPSCRPGAAVPW